MGSSYLVEPAVFLIDTIFSLYIVAIMLRFLLQWIGAEYYNPIVQTLIKITHPPLKLLRRYIPPVGRIDTASLLLALMLQMLADYLILLIKGAPLAFAGLLILSLSQLLSILINIYIFAIFARAILSWINPGVYHSATSILYSLTEPLLGFCRNAAPVAVGGVDFSPLLALIVLQLMKMLLLPPLQKLTVLLG